jgi:lipoprotein-anchoring transpeptidase ErfK/SrfK
MQQLRIWLIPLLIGAVGACAPRQPTQPDPLPPTHEEALPAPAGERDGGARQVEPVRVPLPDTAPPPRVPPAASPQLAAPDRPAAGGNGLRLVVSLADREILVYRGDERVGSYAVAIGQPDHPTPTGDFTIHRIDWNPDWTPPDSEWAEDREYKAPGESGNPMGRVRMVYRMPYTIHGTEDLESLGERESHGSIRMANEDIIELARLVMEAGGEARADAWYERVLDDPTEMVSVTLSEPVPLTNRE